MIFKLPRWVWIGAWVLACTAGIVNVVGFLGFEHISISHMTGTTSMLGAAIASIDLRSTLHLLAIIFAFVAGCALSGFIIQDSTLRLGRRYGVALTLVSLLLFISIPLFKQQSAYAVYAAACACGLQNAMVSTYSGALVRTTHLTGMFTDLGIFLGQSARGLKTDIRRLWLCVMVISGFLCGGIIGAFAYHHLGYNALFIPALTTASMSLLYGMYYLKQTRAG